MEMFGVGYQEVLVILVLLLVVVGPERLPEVAYQIGRAVRTMQAYARQVRDEFSEEIRFIDEQYKVVKGDLAAAQGALRDETARANTELKSLHGLFHAPPPASPAEPPAPPNEQTVHSQPSNGQPPLIF
jgi:Tat protein translocase TatB subunit